MNIMRTEVRKHAERMEERLRENDHKGGWLICSFEYLLRRLREEVDELETSLQYGDTLHETADVANFAMMIADKIAHQETKNESV